MRIIAIILLVIAVSCSPKKIDKKAEGDKVIQLSREWSATAAKGDVEKTVAYWDENAILISANQPALNGKPAIRKMVEDSYKIPGFKISWEPETVEVSDSGDMAYVVENSKVSFADSTGKLITINNKAVSIWRKQKDGNWKNVVDISTPTGN